MRIVVEISAGELVDRVTILELKAQRLAAPCCLAAARDLADVRALLEHSLPDSLSLRALIDALRAVNRELWEVEEELRACEHTQAFDRRFIALARRVYVENDRRAALKRAVDELVQSHVREYKSHALPDV